MEGFISLMRESPIWFFIPGLCCMHGYTCIIHSKPSVINSLGQLGRVFRRGSFLINLHSSIRIALTTLWLYMPRLHIKPSVTTAQITLHIYMHTFSKYTVHRWGLVVKHEDNKSNILLFLSVVLIVVVRWLWESNWQFVAGDLLSVRYWWRRQCRQRRT